MRVVTADGETIELGTTETAPTIGIVDYSRRVTDDFGVTTVVERGFARRMSVKLGVPFDDVDALQRRLADLRATSALWVADERFASLSVQGFYKEFEVNLAVPPLSFCTLTVEGLVATDPLTDAGSDPAPVGCSSTLQLLQPVLVTDATLAASSVIENDYPEWSSSLSYALGARVIKAATHRVYESAQAANAGNDPAGASGLWIDAGPTKRWAMFDQALGTAATGIGSIEVALTVGTVQAVALLDVVGTAVRVRAAGYDRTIPVGTGAVTFLDLPSVTSAVTVTITGPDIVSVGTLLIGGVVSLGITESSPTAGITDYSRKDVDDFGEVTIVQRAWAKRMTAKALIRTDAIDAVANRIAAVRARPALWIGQAGLDSLTIYGFFKDFSIEAGEDLSKLSLSIEGLSVAAKVEPLSVEWENVKDGNPDKPKPADGATNSEDPASPLGPDDTVGEVLNFLAEARRNATEGLEQIAATKIEVDRLLVQARQTIQAAMSGQLLEQRRKARTDFLTHLNGVQVGVAIQEETTQRVEGELATATTFSLLGAKNSTGTAFILNSATVLVAPTQSLAQKFETIEVQFEDAASEISRLDTAVADETSARTESIALARSDFTAGIGTATALIADLTTTVADADHALGERITNLDSSFQTALGLTNASIVTVQQSVADESSARATAIANLSASFNTAFSSASSTFSEAIADEASARATQYGTVTARLNNVDGSGASVEQMFTAQADALGNLSARASLAVTAGGVWSGIFVTAADGSTGPISDITLAAMTINVSTAKLIFNNGAIMKVLGTGFGVGNEFVSWFGPSMPFSQCTRANGTTWETVTGEAYFGGSLSAGVLTNGGQTSSIGPDALADTGGFGSNGGKITVVMSWSYTWTWTVRYPGTTAGRDQFDNAAANYGATSTDGSGYSGTRVESGSPTLTLAREIGGASRINVATASISPGSGKFQGQRPLPAGSEEGYADFSASWSTSLTYTDPDRVVTDRRFIATLARSFTPGVGAVSQRVTIITTEE